MKELTQFHGIAFKLSRTHNCIKFLTIGSKHLSRIRLRVSNDSSPDFTYTCIKERTCGLCCG